MKNQRIKDGNIPLSYENGYKFKGEFIRANEENFNGHIYYEHEVEREMKKLDEKILMKRALGEIDHPTDTESSDRAYDTINLVYSSHKITDIERVGNIWYGTIELLSAGYGKQLRGFVDDGVSLSTSIRAFGYKDDNGMVADLTYITQDIVLDPALETAVLTSIMDRKQLHNVSDATDRAYKKLAKANKNTLAQDLIDFFTVV